MMESGDGGAAFISSMGLNVILALVSTLLVVFVAPAAEGECVETEKGLLLLKEHCFC